MAIMFNFGFVTFFAFGAYILIKWLLLQGYSVTGGRVAEALNSSYDYIVVGGGSAGTVVAARLSENPNVSVLLLEAGGEETASPNYHIPGHMLDHTLTDIDWMYQIVKQENAQGNRKPGNEEFWGAGRVLGGGSIINYMQYTRCSKYDYDAWERTGCTGWSYKDVLPYFLKSEDIQVNALKNSTYHGIGGFLGVSDSKDNPLEKTFLDAGVELGYENVDHNGEKEIGFSSLYWTSKNGVRSSPSRDLLRGAMTRDNLHVSVRSFVTKVVFQDKKAVGVEFIKSGVKKYIGTHKEIILSAGALGSPKVLLLSGVGPAKELQKLNIPVIADLPVGKNLQYHYIIPFWVNTNSTHLVSRAPTAFDYLKYLAFDSGTLATQITAGVAFLRTDSKETSGAADFQIQFLNSKLPSAMTGLKELKYIDKKPGFMFFLFLLHPKSTGLIQLRNRDPFDPAIFDPKYLSDKSDMDSIIKGIRIIQKIIQTNSMRKHNISMDILHIQPCKHATFDSDEFWDCYVRNILVGGHHVGTCKMGDVNDPKTVVGPDMAVKGIKGLRVMDASMLPTSTSGNTNAPCIMVGEKGADLILKQLSIK